MIGGYFGICLKFIFKLNKLFFFGNWCNIDDCYDGFERFFNILLFKIDRIII